MAQITKKPILDTGIAAAVYDEEYKDAEATNDGTEAPLTPSKVETPLSPRNLIKMEH